METEEYYQQLQAINQKLEGCPEGIERSELLSLKQSIEELLSLTDEVQTQSELYSEENVTTLAQEENNGENNSNIDDEYAIFMAEMAKEGAVEVSNDSSTNRNQNNKKQTVFQSGKSLKHLEGKKYRAPHKHQWGQVVYHNAMICSVPDDIPSSDELKVRVLFLNPTHKEMQPCPYYFHLERECNFSDEECGFSHGEWVSFSSLCEYVEPKFELLTIGSDVLAKQSNNLWYRAKIVQIFKEREMCLVKFDSKNIENQAFEEVMFAHVLPLAISENKSESDSDSDSDVQVVEEDFEVQLVRNREELINKSLMTAPEGQRLGDWEKYTKGIGSRLMQKMGYIVGTGLGKEGSGIIKPVTALILPQGKSLDYCMNLKTSCNDPDLFNADRRRRGKQKSLGQRRAKTRAKAQIRIEQMDVVKFINFKYSSQEITWLQKDDKEFQLLRDKLKLGSDKDVNTANFLIEEKLKKYNEAIVDLKSSIKRLDDVHANTEKLIKRLREKELEVKKCKTYKLMIQNEIDRRKNNKDMAVF